MVGWPRETSVGNGKLFLGSSGPWHRDGDQKVMGGKRFQLVPGPWETAWYRRRIPPRQACGDLMVAREDGCACRLA
jgi:hypothetical protein